MLASPPFLVPTEPDVTESPTASFIRLLGRGPFARYMRGETISMIGTWMQLFAQGWVMTDLSLKAESLGWLTFCSGIPTLALAMYGGSIADRYDKRRILFVVLAVQVALAILVGGLVQHHSIAIWHLYAITALLGIVTAFEMPTVSAFVPELVAREDLAKALAIDRSLFHFTRIVGPAIGGYLIGHFGAPTAYYVNAASFLALGIALCTIPRRAIGSAEEEKERQGPMSAGFQFVRRDPATRAMVLLMGFAAIFVSPFFMVTMPLYARGVLGLDAGHMGWLMGFSGLGSLSGALTLLYVKKGYRTPFLRFATIMGAVGLGGMAMAPSFEVASVAMVCMTFGLSSGFGTANIVIQERAPDAIRGRVSAVASIAFFGTLPFAGLLISTVADHIGLRLAMGLGAIGFALAAFSLLAGHAHLSAEPKTEESGPVAS